MNETIRETENFEFFKCIFNGITAICSKKTNEQSNWNTDSLEIRNEINHIKHLNNTDFDLYCKTVLKNQCNG